MKEKPIIHNHAIPVRFCPRRKNPMRFLAAGALFLLGAGLSAGEAKITQVDSSRLFLSSRLDVFLDVSGINEEAGGTGGAGGTDRAGEAALAVLAEDLEFHQIAAGEPRELTVLDIQRNSESAEKITFLLVLDNSGSMYDAPGNAETRNAQALKAVETFTGQLDPQKDRVGLAVFSRDYQLLADPRDGIAGVREALTSVSRPSRDEAYTEIYYAICRAAEEMADIKGRKAVVFLSDGENFPYHERTGAVHPEIGDKNYLPREAAEALTQAEVTLYAVNFAREKDLPLGEIALTSGGRVFDAYNEAELGRVYSEIRRNIQGEYRVGLRVPVSFEERPEIRVSFRGVPGDSRTYATGLIFGGPVTETFYPGLALIVLGAVLWLVLVLMRFERSAARGEIRFLPAGSGSTLVKTQILSSDRTVIGSSAQAAMTISGIPSLEATHAVIQRDEATGNYTVLSQREILVNNQPVKKRKLRPGDVLNLEGATVIFDAPEPPED